MIKTYDEFLNENLKNDPNYQIADIASDKLKWYYDRYRPIFAAHNWVKEYLLNNKDVITYSHFSKVSIKLISDLETEATRHASTPWPSAKQIMKMKILKVLNGENIR